MANRVRKITEATSEIGVKWNYYPTEINLADLGGRGATIAKMEKGNWLTGPNWLLDKKQWPQQPKLKCSKKRQTKSVSASQRQSFKYKSAIRKCGMRF